MNKHEKMMYKKEKDKTVGKGVLALVIIAVLAFSFAYGIVKSLFIIPSTIEDTVNKCFSNSEPYPPTNNMIDHENGWIVVSANASSVEDAMVKLKETYAKLGKKITTKKVDKIMVSVYEYSGLDWGLMNPYKKGDLLFTSNMWLKDIKSINWNEVKTYKEFEEKANID